MKAVMLAAGMGSRLGKYTEDNTKCMLDVAGKKLIDRAIEAVIYAGIKTFILVIGYKGENLKNYILETYNGSEIEFVFVENKVYSSTNNIYSLFLAKDLILDDDIILMESDLIFEKKLIKEMIDNPNEDLVAVAKYESWMDGTVVTCDECGNIVQFLPKTDIDYKNIFDCYKTVNIYKFSKDFINKVYFPFLEAYMSAYGLNSYYETVLKVIAHLKKSSLKVFFMENRSWYEIDDSQDYDIATVLFSEGKEKYDRLISKFGGYWRYNKIIDFCYLVNPYFPQKNLIDKLNSEFQVLLTQYPSGLNMQNMNAERIFGVDQRFLLVGNGASELINALGNVTSGEIAVNLPTFNEYIRCFRNANITIIDNSENDYQFNIAKINEACASVDAMFIVNPDNPSGAMLSFEEIIGICENAKRHNTRIIIDESFVDFAAKDLYFSLLDNDILKKYPNLIVIKSISKSYGVPALRLGVLASSDEILLAKIRDVMQIWNINSFAEYFLQVFPLFSSSYRLACSRICDERNRLYRELTELGLKAYPSQANYIMIDLGKINSYDFCVSMLNDHNILIKDLSQKSYFTNKNFIRIAIRDENDNKKLIDSIKDMLGKFVI